MEGDRHQQAGRAFEEKAIFKLFFQFEGSLFMLH